MKFTPAAELATRSTGFGFDEIMRDPNNTRFPAWYARFSRVVCEPRPGIGAAAPSAADAKAGFGFDGIMCNPDYTRFPAWYTRFSHLASEAAGTEAAPCFDLKEAA